MSTLAPYFAMGGYAAFVWPAYGLSAITLGGLAGWSWRRYRQSLAALSQLQQRAGRRDDA
jgi:heme exporter protein D